MVEDLAQKLRERRVLTQDEWHSKDGYKEDIHSGFCTSALKVKKEITAFPTKLTPPSALLQSREGAAAVLLPGGEFPAHLLTDWAISYCQCGPQPQLPRSREAK